VQTRYPVLTVGDDGGGDDDIKKTSRQVVVREKGESESEIVESSNMYNKYSPT